MELGQLLQKVVTHRWFGGLLAGERAAWMIEEGVSPTFSVLLARGFEDREGWKNPSTTVVVDDEVMVDGEYRQIHGVSGHNLSKVLRVFLDRVEDPRGAAR